MSIEPGNVVRHPTQPEWGIGEVLEVISDNKVKVRFEHSGEKLLGLKYVTLVIEEGVDASALKFEKGTAYEHLIGRTIDEMQTEYEEGRKIYAKNKKEFAEKGRNTQEWDDDKRGKSLKKIVDFCGGKAIPFCFFCYSKKASFYLFASKNDYNYIFYTINMGVELRKLKEDMRA